MVGYLGPEGTFSHMAVSLYTKKNDELKKYSSIYKLIKAVKEGEIESAVVPIENSIEGSVNSTLDALAAEGGMYICGEITIKVCENLIAANGTKLSDIRKIMSHPQPIGQCSGMINENFPNVQIEYTDSTAAAAKYIAETGDNSIAMIGPKACAELYGLEVLMADCGDEKHNSTRFVELRREQKIASENTKTSLVFTTPNEPGALYKVIEIFSEYGINMLKIESRPDKKGMGTYIFFVDIDGSINDKNIKTALDIIAEITSFYRFLGSYEKG